MLVRMRWPLCEKHVIGYLACKPFALFHLYNGRDVFPWFPTGYGKSISFLGYGKVYKLNIRLRVFHVMASRMRTNIEAIATRPSLFLNLN